MISRFKNIIISETNYNILKQLGSTGESFNDVITNVLKVVPRAALRGEIGDGE
ncbi:MAG TPA: hypothetical protein VH796_18255 [Nitrososphaeraceae archaeon]|jgi:predicted CopG family antitoxin